MGFYRINFRLLSIALVFVISIWIIFINKKSSLSAVIPFTSNSDIVEETPLTTITPIRVKSSKPKKSRKSTKKNKTKPTRKPNNTNMVYPGIRVPAKAAHTATVIFLHGLGDSPAGWVFFAQEAARQGRLKHVKFVFAEAPNQPVTLNYGMVMPAWYDIKSLNNVMGQQDEEGIFASIDRLKQVINEEIQDGLASNRIVIGGFSQGCAISLGTSVVYDKPLGGVVGLSGYLPIHEKIAAQKSNANIDTPYFLGHGTADQVVKFSSGQMSRDFLKNTLHRSKLEWHQYEGMLHTASPEEIEEVFKFLEKAIP